jgi:hypothetical protein
MKLLTVQNAPNTSSCGYTERIISMMIGVALSRGEVSMRINPSIGSAISSSAGSDMFFDLLVDEKRCERGYFVG